MQTPEVDDFEILELYRTTAHNFPAITIADGKYGYLNQHAFKIGLKEGSSQVSFARSGEYIFLTFLPPLSEVKGYILSKKPGPKEAYYNVFYLRSLIKKFNVAPGCYKINIEESVFKKDLTWYPLELIEKQIGLIKK